MYHKSSRLLAGLSAVAMAAVWAMPAHAQMSEELTTRLSQNVDQHVIVIMKSQHSAVHKDSSEVAQRSAAIDTEQAPLLEKLRQVHAANIKSYHLVNALAATVSTAELGRLEANPAVAAVVADVTIRRQRETVSASKATNSVRGNNTASLVPNVIPGACGANGQVQLAPEGLALTHAIIEAGLNRLDYFVQAMTSAIANQADTLPPLMRQAGFRYVFLGIENVLEGDLQFLRAAAKNRAHENGTDRGNATVEAIEALHRNKMLVVGGLIVGNPDDTRESIEVNLEFARRYVDWPYIQHPTPYPGTPMADDFRQHGLIANQCLEEYDGTTAVIRTKHLPAEEVEFMRWKAERWMKVRHMPMAFRHDSWFILRHAPEMFSETFRGCTFRSLLRLEDDRKAFERYKAIRKRERVYV